MAKAYQQETSLRGGKKGILSRLKNEKGATEIAEYAVTILIVVATITAMTTYFRRAVQARIRDARHYMIKNVGAACNDKSLTANCMYAASIPPNIGRISEQYEPYYSHVSSVVNQDSVTYKRLMASNVGTTGNFAGQILGDLKSATGSTQSPPISALNDIQ